LHLYGGGTTERAVHADLHRQEQPDHLGIGKQVCGDLAGAQLGRTVGQRQRQQELIRQPGIDGAVAEQKSR
jgi:hypothetical protein